MHSTISYNTYIRNVRKLNPSREYAIRNKRLLRVARLLDKLTKPFNLVSWKSTIDPCGTACCAVGWAAQDKWFNERGLSISKGRHMQAPQYKGRKGWAAVQQFFHLTLFEAEKLFSSLHYKPEDIHNPKAVADRIRKFVKRTTPK